MRSIKKLLSLRVFDRALAPEHDGGDADGGVTGQTPSVQRWASSVVDIQGEILLGALEAALLVAVVSVAFVSPCVCG